MEGNVVMLPLELIVAVVLMATEATKATLKRRLNLEHLSPFAAPAIALLLGALFNLLNLVLFGPDLTVGLIREAAREGIMAAAAAAGIYSAANNYLERRKAGTDNVQG